MKKKNPIVLIVIACIFLLALTGGCAKREALHFKSVEDLAEQRIGIIGGTIYDKLTSARFPAAQVLRYSEQADLILALQNNKIDAAITNFAAAKHLIKTNPDVGILTDDLFSFPIGIGFNKNNPALREQFNAFLTKRKIDGSLDALYKKWFTTALDTIRMPAYPAQPTTRKISVGVAIGDLPSVGYVNNEYVGFDIELIREFAQHEKIGVSFVSLEFGALIASLASGKVDMIADCIAITEERKQQVAFSEPYMVDKSAAIVLNKRMTAAGATEKVAAPVDWMKALSDRFYTNIVHEKRYLLIWDGLKTTVILSIFSILFGTLLGAGVCFLRMSRRKPFHRAARFYISLVRGIPVLVLLMITYYIVFGDSDISPVFVAVLAFGVNFAAYVAEMFRSAIESIDKGQTEAGIAGGFTPLQTFFHIIMPQAIPRVLPVFKGEVISLVKMTSVVGYVAVQDLTKAGDIIRSRTFDAFFPLIMTAALYFAISWLLLQLLGLVETWTDPRARRHRTVAARRGQV